MFIAKVVIVFSEACMSIFSFIEYHVGLIYLFFGDIKHDAEKRLEKSEDGYIWIANRYD